MTDNVINIGDIPGADLPTRSNNTIAAISTPRGMGGIAIIRISGDMAHACLKAVISPYVHEFISHKFTHAHAVDAHGRILDEVMCVFMKAPRSYTREDVAEIQCHGGFACARAVLDAVLSAGARPAEPGEFTKRAFLNGRIDLSEAEAVMQMVGANSAMAMRASARQLTGGAHTFVNALSKQLVDMLALIEAGFDFPEEVDEKDTRERVVTGLREAISYTDKRTSRRAAKLLRQGASIVIAGKPNVGKSSLLNAILSCPRAIVTSIAGTTRDVLTERLELGGIVAEISDTAGLRETADEIEQEGVNRAMTAIDEADIVLLVLDSSQPLDAHDESLINRADERYILCLNKIDLEPNVVEDFMFELEAVEVSATCGIGVDKLLKTMLKRLESAQISEESLVVERQLDLADSAKKHMLVAANALVMGVAMEAVVTDIREALNDISQITGKDATREVINAVFENFCVGK